MSDDAGREPLKLTREEWERVEYDDFAQEARNRGKMLVPLQYVALFKTIAETGFWPALYDAAGRCLGDKK